MFLLSGRLGWYTRDWVAHLGWSLQIQALREKHGFIKATSCVFSSTGVLASLVLPLLLHSHLIASTSSVKVLPSHLLPPLILPRSARPFTSDPEPPLHAVCTPRAKAQALIRVVETSLRPTDQLCVRSRAVRLCEGDYEITRRHVAHEEGFTRAVETGRRARPGAHRRCDGARAATVCTCVSVSLARV